MASTHDIDWDAVRRDYATGCHTNAELSKRFGVSAARIGQVAKRDGWKRDLSAAVKVATRANLVRAAASERAAARRKAAAEITAHTLELARVVRVGKVKRLTEEQVREIEASPEVDEDLQAVNDAAEANAEIVTRHQRLAEQMAQLLDRMRAQLLEVSDQQTIAQLVEAINASGEKDAGRLAERLQHVTSLNQRIAGLDKLAAAAARIVAMERQAHSLDGDGPKEDNDYEAALRKLSESRPA